LQVYSFYSIYFVGNLALKVVVRMDCDH